MRFGLVAAVLASSVLAQQAALAAEVTVQMASFDKATRMSNVFSPGLVRINKGDTVKWVSDSTVHNVAFVDGGVPSGVAPFISTAAKEISYTFQKPGIYLVKCAPHAGIGMVGLVLVGGDKSNLAAVKAATVSLQARKRLEPLFAEIEAGH